MTAKRPIRVLVGSPTSGSECTLHKQSIFNLVGQCNPDEIYVRPQDVEGSNIAMNQNALARMAVEQGFDYLLLSETDVGFPAHALHELLSYGKDIIGVTTAWKQRDNLTKVLDGGALDMRMMGHELDNTEITLASLDSPEPIREVAFIPMGLTLISTDAIKRVSDYRRANVLPCSFQEHAKGKWVPVFSHTEYYPPDRDEGVIGTTDGSFCREARDAGLSIWLASWLSTWIEHEGRANFTPPKRMRDAIAARQQSSAA